MAFSFQIANEIDGIPLLRFSERLFRETYSGLNSPGNMELYCEKAFSPVYFEEDFRQENVRFLLAYEEKTLAAYAKLVLGSATPIEPSRIGVEIARFYLDTPFQGIGLGQKFMNHCLGWAREQGYPCVWLGVWPENPRAVHFYERIGFEKIGTADFLLGTDPQTDDVMLINV
jgi:ribosomal protein S18 acetylase RimI-like enzyme